MALTPDHDTIVAQATAVGKGGVGIIRISGPAANVIATKILGLSPKVRYAHYGDFIAHNGDILDQGIGLFFQAPHSFTGEDVLELQGHGGQIILDLLIKDILTYHQQPGIGAVRLAQPGEFSERAFLNDKLDLAQAEAIADLIEASSEHAARSALRSLQGEFSTRIHTLVDAIIQLRMYVEAAIDFPEEEIDFLSDGKVQGDLEAILAMHDAVAREAKQGTIIREGMKVVIAGRPNAGKSSLLNALAGRDTAIVTDIAGTTRDVLSEHIHIDGMPLHIIDTAGLRESPDKVEQIGIERAWQAIKEADRVLFVVDSTESEHADPHQIWPEFMAQLPPDMGVTVVRNKADLSGLTICSDTVNNYPVIALSAAQKDGIELLAEHLKACMGYVASTEGQFMARRRHVTALNEAKTHLDIGYEQLMGHFAGELLAEELRLAQHALNEITGEFTSDDLLGKIFSSFCIGK
jgi:tRNA modification GTPase